MLQDVAAVFEDLLVVLFTMLQDVAVVFEDFLVVLFYYVTGFSCLV